MTDAVINAKGSQESWAQLFGGAQSTGHVDVHQFDVRAAESLAFGLNPIVSAAGELLYTGLQLRNAKEACDLALLQQLLIAKVGEFEEAMRIRGVRHEHVIGARYVMCTFLDEIVASSSWGGSWSATSLLVHFHKETWGGEKFFQLLERLKESANESRDLLELMYVCMSYGFAGRYLVLDGGMQQHEVIRKNLGELLRTLRPSANAEMASQWQGVSKQSKRSMVVVPIWVAAALLSLAALLLYLFLSLRLNQFSDPVFGSIQSLRVKSSGDAIPAKEARFSRFLEREVREGLVSVADYEDRSVVTILGDSSFSSGSADVLPIVLPVLHRIGLELKKYPGAVVINGHTDNQPISNLRFPSNWQLSKARAESVATVLVSDIGKGRIEVKGSADSESVADNSTAIGRAKNRRVEITVFITNK
ncbi:type VI secretion system protein TssL, long form [Chitinibacter sp. FCG-7]|uniref:Type VI secretion system protein TssL, long form n=1 Tax=Chitinibacter mangrovi TaxID=3153927 RepID=A0AAU7FAN0_9NEIS